VASRPTTDVVGEFTRGGLWVAIVVMSGWHVLATLPLVLIVWASHGPVPSGAPIWAGYAIAGAVSAVTALGYGEAGDERTPKVGTADRGTRASMPSRDWLSRDWRYRDWWYSGWRSGALPWTVCALLLAGVVANALTLPGGFFGTPSFGFTSAGWFALVALWHRRLGELLAFFAANAAVGFLALAALHEISRTYVAMFLVAWCGSSVFQVTIYVGSRAVAEVAGRAARAEDAATRARYARLAADAVQTARRNRYETIRATVVRLLEGLATGTLDLDATPTRQEIAVAVTRLRRFLVENDDVPDPLSHELRACADAAERRGVAVDLIAAAGTIPLLPVSVRRALVEPVIQVLAATASRARITVVASRAEVTVAIVADASLPRLGALSTAERPTGDGVVADGPAWDMSIATGPITDGDGAVRCDLEEEGGRLWAQARWRGSSASLSSMTTTWS
jgi:hypothetical protein